MSSVILGLPKGRFIQQSFAAMRSLGVVEGCDSKRLTWSVRMPQVTVVVKLLKVQDIAALLACGDIHFGVAPDEWIREHRARAVEVLDLGWCHTRMVLANSGTPLGSGIRDGAYTVATTYPNLAAECLGSLIPGLNIRHVHGSAEGLVPDLCDGIFDCVETGATLDLHGLTAIHTFMHSSVRLFATSPQVMASHGEHIARHFANTFPLEN